MWYLYLQLTLPLATHELPSRAERAKVLASSGVAVSKGGTLLRDLRGICRRYLDI